MSNELKITLDWELLERGKAEECATFAAVGIFHGEACLSLAEDKRVNRTRARIHLSAYQLAQWLAWNWWRLRWEPRRLTTDWKLAHNLASIGGGYIWPNISIWSDGQHIVINSKPAKSVPEEPIRYLADYAAILPVAGFEQAADEFVEQVLAQLHAEAVHNTNLETIWTEVLAERGNQKTAQYRRLEALSGFDVDAADPNLIERLLIDADKLGEPGVQELAAAHTPGALLPDSNRIERIAQNKGFDSNQRDAVRLQDKSSGAGGVVAWKRGVLVAHALRKQLKLAADAPVSNKQLCELAAVQRNAITTNRRAEGLSFLLDQAASGGKLVLRSGYRTGRRFEMARLIGDRIAMPDQGALRPATRSYTYRQQLQRAFAGEFLCPFEALDEKLSGDYSDEAIEEAAQRYDVSGLTVRTLLVNHKRIERENLEGLLDEAV